MALVVQIKKEGSTWEAVGRHAVSYAKGHALAASTDKNGNELWVHLRTVDAAEKGEGELVADLLSTDSDRSAHFKIPTYSRLQNGELTQAFLNPYVRKDGTNGLRALVSTRSSTVCMIQQEFVVWEVQGGLAHTLQVRMSVERQDSPLCSAPHPQNTPDCLAFSTTVHILFHVVRAHLSAMFSDSDLYMHISCIHAELYTENYAPEASLSSSLCPLVDSTWQFSSCSPVS